MIAATSGSLGDRHHHQVVASGEVHQLVHRAGSAREVHGHDRARPLADALANGLGREVHAAGIDVGQHGGRAHVEDGVRGGAEGEGGGDDLV